jgi:hypothetical protein
MNITNKYIDIIDGKEYNRVSVDDVESMRVRYLERITNIVGEDNEKLLNDIKKCLVKYNLGYYNKAHNCLKSFIKNNPEIADDLSSFYEICYRVINTEKDELDLLYENYLIQKKYWRKKHLYTSFFCFFKSQNFRMY